MKLLTRSMVGLSIIVSTSTFVFASENSADTVYKKREAQHKVLKESKAKLIAIKQEHAEQRRKEAKKVIEARVKK